MSGLRHDALLHDGRDDLVERLLPFVRAGLERGDAVLAVTSAANAVALRAGLDGAAGLVDWRDSSDWYRSPGSAFRRYADYVAARAGKGCVRVVGEPVWPLDWRDGVREWARYESFLNVGFADAPAWIVCPYDVSALPEAVVEHARRTHPALHDGGERVPHEGYVEPAAFWESTRGPGPDGPPAGARSLPVTAELAALRAAVAAEAAAAGLPEPRVSELVAAVHELAINALTHGGGDAVLRTWRTVTSFVCELEDRGPGIAGTFAGYRAPAAEKAHGRGLWLARQLCDLVDVSSGADGTRVRVQMRRPRPRRSART